MPPPRDARRHRDPPSSCAWPPPAPGDFSGIRDGALHLLTAAGLGRSALVGLDAEHVRFSATAVKRAVPQAGPDRDLLRRVAIPRGATLATCPAQALRAWPDRSDTRFGPVFRKIDRWGTIEPRRLGTDALRRILAHRPRHRPASRTRHPA